MKKLVFGAADDAKELYGDLYGSFQIGEKFLTGVKTIRTAVKIYDALELIAERIVRGEGVPDGFRLAEGGGIVLLEDEEFNVLKQAVDLVVDQAHNALTAATRILQRPMDARHAVRLLEFLEKAETVEKVQAVATAE